MAEPNQPDRRPTETEKAPTAADEQPGTNEVQHEPDPKAEPDPTADRPYHPRSPYTAGNY